MRRLRRALNARTSDVAGLTGLPVQPFTLEWSTETPVAMTQNGVIYLNYDWFKAHPDDYGALVHEYTHLVQDVPYGTCPGDVIEGFADAVRYILGLYDSSWWSPSPMAAFIAAMTPTDRVALSQAMAAGQYDPSLLKGTP